MQPVAASQAPRAVAERWYSVRSVGDGVSLIHEPHVADWLRCNIWHVRGRDRDLLVDSGMGLRPLKAEVALLTEKPVVAVSSHAHFDHIGGAHEFDCRLAHAAEADIHAGPTRANTAADPAFLRAETLTALPHAGYSIDRFQVTPAPLTGTLDEGDLVDLGDRAFRVLHLPGHSPGSIALYEPATETLFSGDVVYDGDLFDWVYHSDRDLYRESLARLRDLPVRTIHGGHGESFGRARMVEVIDGYLAGGNRVLDAAAWIEAQL